MLKARQRLSDLDRPALIWHLVNPKDSSWSGRWGEVSRVAPELTRLAMVPAEPMAHLRGA